MKTIYVLLFTLCSLNLFSQTVVFSENIGDPGNNPVPIPFHTFQNDGLLTYFGNADVRNSVASTGYPGASGAGNIFLNNDSGSRFFSISGANTQNYTFLSLSFGLYKSTIGSNGSELLLEYSIDNGSNWLPLTITALPTGTGTAIWFNVSVNLPIPAQNQPSLAFRWTNTGSGMGSPQFRIDDIHLEGDYTPPVIITSISSVVLPPVVIGQTVQSTYNVSAEFLIQDVLVESDNPTFDLWDMENADWFPSIILLKDGQQLAGEPVEIIVRHNPAAAVGDEYAIYRHSTFGGEDVIVEVFGTSIAVEPTIASTNFIATPTPEGQIALNWTAGDGGRRLIMAREGQPVTFVPTDGIPPQDANQDFGLAPSISNNKFVYDGTAEQTLIYGLNPATTYYFTIYEYNEGTGNSQNYLTNPVATASAMTPLGPPGIQILQASTAYHINFQETVPNVLNGEFNGTGMSPAGLPGKLNTSSWKISLSPFVTTLYSSNPPANPNLARGTSNGVTMVGGIYAFQTGGGNIALGVKPFNNSPSQNNVNRVFSNQPGFVELRTQNKTEQPVEEMYVSFVYYVFNSAAASTELKVSYSTNGNTFTELTDMVFQTPSVADVTPSWKKHVRSFKVSGLNIPADGNVYIRWTGQDAGSYGFNPRDAIAFDDITVAMDPDSNFEGGTFSGVIHSGRLAANALLSDTSQIVDSLILKSGAVLSTAEHTLTLGDGVSINETDGYIKGNLLVARTIVANIAQTFGGIGLSIVSDQNPGLTQVRRVTGEYKNGTGGASDNESIRRWFEIVPANNSNLNATMAFTFKPFESPNFTPTQANFRLYRRAIGSSNSWVEMDAGILAGNTYTITGVQSFNAEITGADYINAPLPLNWVSFDVKHDKGINYLKWVTTNELNTNRFEIEKSYSGTAFESIATLSARPGSTLETYLHSDKHDRSGLMYYRIKQWDDSQKYSYSPVRSVRASVENKLKLFPTVVSQSTTLSSPVQMEVELTITDTAGKVIKSSKNSFTPGEQDIPLHDLSPGVYWIHIQNQEINETFRIVKQ